jgi:hypothetical protein
MNEPAIKNVPDEDAPIADAVREAARGQVVRLTIGGERVVAILPESLLEAVEDAADAADADAAAAWDEADEWIPWDRARAELGL